MTPLLRARDVIVDYGGVHAVDELTLEVERGTLYGLIGPNGSGKSTFLAAVSRLVDVSAGTLEFDGREYTTMPTHAAIAMGIARTFQTVRLQPTMTVLENVMIGADEPLQRRSILSNWLRVGRGRADERHSRELAREALARVGMEGQADRHPGTLSYGSQRKVEIARALASRPQLLLLDEPTAGMSRSERDEVGELLIDLARDGLTQVLVEHDLAMIHSTCGHVYALNFGRLIASGTPAEIVADPGVREAYMGVTAAAETEAA